MASRINPRLAKISKLIKEGYVKKRRSAIQISGVAYSSRLNAEATEKNSFHVMGAVDHEVI